MPVPTKIVQLIERFKNNVKSYKSGNYKEHPLRSEYIDRFFEALGWDMANKKGNAEAYKEVVHEDAIRIGRATKAPDYSFRIDGDRKFFLEAKRPSVNIKNDMLAAFQLRRYGWSAKLPLSILTDFEEFAVYDCRIKPKKTDKASHSRILLFNCTEYVDNWDTISNIFSPEAILRGSFDKYVESQKAKKGTTEVDTAFLIEIERWRELLARNIALRNPALSQRELNFAIQLTIDRIVFLRICEDRGIEKYGKLKELTKGSKLYGQLFKIFQEADEKYNSGLFHFKEENGRSKVDCLTPHLKVDDKVLKDIFKNIYYPDSPYEFSVLPSDILGQVYEKFLGKVITLTSGHSARITDKPEVRKAGGVYYTPTYIVDYIVKKTVGELVKGKNPGPRGAVSNIKIIDPACGSGSFLLGAYQFLLDWHLLQYTKDDHQKWARGKSPRLYQSLEGEWLLTTEERKRILMNNIFGVDIDQQAVEVTKLSLLLKVLEGEDVRNINKQLHLFHERVLPDLSNNIKCGNSLIGPDFFDSSQVSLLDEEELHRINTFDWATEFSEIINNGGFDAVIGNPPYGFHQIHSHDVKPYFKATLESSAGSFEHYFLFYEKSLKLIKNNGLHGFIVPVTWLTIPSAQSLRKFILSNFWIKEICWLPELVFENAQVNTLISIIKKSKSKRNVNIKIYDTLGFNDPPVKKHTQKQKYFIDLDYYLAIFEGDEDNALINQIASSSQPLSEIAKPCSGYNPYERGKGIAPNGGTHTRETVKNKPYHSTNKINSEWKPEIIGRNLRRYTLKFSGKRYVKYGPWLAAPRDRDNFSGKRILVQEITGGKTKRIVAAFYEKELYYSRDVIPIKITNKFPDPFYLLGIINSRLISWYHLKRNPKAQKGLFPKVLVSDLKNLPIAKAKKSDHRYNTVVDLVMQIIAANKKLDAAKTPHDKNIIERRIGALDRQIDSMVYELYGLSKDQIKLVESGI